MKLRPRMWMDVKLFAFNHMQLGGNMLPRRGNTIYYRLTSTIRHIQ